MSELQIPSSLVNHLRLDWVDDVCNEEALSQVRDALHEWPLLARSLNAIEQFRIDRRLKGVYAQEDLSYIEDIVGILCANDNSIAAADSSSSCIQQTHRDARHIWLILSSTLYLAASNSLNDDNGMDDFSHNMAVYLCVSTIAVAKEGSSLLHACNMLCIASAQNNLMATKVLLQGATGLVSRRAASLMDADAAEEWESATICVSESARRAWNQFLEDMKK